MGARGVSKLGLGAFDFGAEAVCKQLSCLELARSGFNLLTQGTAPPLLSAPPLLT